MTLVFQQIIWNLESEQDIVGFIQKKAGTSI